MTLPAWWPDCGGAAWFQQAAPRLLWLQQLGDSQATVPERLLTRFVKQRSEAKDIIFILALVTEALFLPTFVLHLHLLS